VKDTRRGESLWSEWTGELYERETHDSVVFFTVEHVDIENEVVRRALASTVQREGLVSTLGEGFKAVEAAVCTQSYAGELHEHGNGEYAICNDKGETSLGDKVENLVPVTLVEL
jgi:ABC-type transport system substrate-binding protein